MKEKMLMKLERDRVKAKNEAIEAQMKAMQVSSRNVLPLSISFCPKRGLLFSSFLGYALIR